MLTAEDTKLEPLQFAILFMIADMFLFWVKNQDKCMLSDESRTQKN